LLIWVRVLGGSFEWQRHIVQVYMTVFGRKWPRQFFEAVDTKPVDWVGFNGRTEQRSHNGRATKVQQRGRRVFDSLHPQISTGHWLVWATGTAILVMSVGRTRPGRASHNFTLMHIGSVAKQVM
jgi:hypothetical protein